MTARPARKRSACRFPGRDVLRKEAGRPKLPCDIAEIERSAELDQQKRGRERLCNEGKPQNHRRQIDHVPDDKPESHEEGFPKAGPQRTRDERRHARTGNDASDKESAAIGEKSRKCDDRSS